VGMDARRLADLVTRAQRVLTAPHPTRLPRGARVSRLQERPPCRSRP
jgi:hypothetical protein